MLHEHVHVAVPRPTVPICSRASSTRTKGRPALPSHGRCERASQVSWSSASSVDLLRVPLGVLVRPVRELARWVDAAVLEALTGVPDDGLLHHPEQQNHLPLALVHLQLLGALDLEPPRHHQLPPLSSGTAASDTRAVQTAPSGPESAVVEKTSDRTCSPVSRSAAASCSTCSSSWVMFCE